MMKNILLVLSLIVGRVAALQCEIPGECIGQFIGSTSQNSSAECLATCKGTYYNKLKGSKLYLNLSN